jgi:CheY-like chemotaxis protein
MVCESDASTRHLVVEWLRAGGWVVVSEASGERAAVAVVDVPHPRRGGDPTLRRLRARLSGMPIVAMSSSFLSNVESCGACARLLGVQRVVPKPLVREALLEAVSLAAGDPP